MASAPNTPDFPGGHGAGPPEAPRKRALPALAPFFDGRAILVRSALSRRPRVLTGMRVRKKLAVLHTVFTLLLGAVLLTTLRPAVRALVRAAEMDKSAAVLDIMTKTGAIGPGDDGGRSVRVGTPEELRIAARGAVVRALAQPGSAVAVEESVVGPGAVVFLGVVEGRHRFAALRERIPGAHEKAARLYMIVGGALLGAYVLVALALELLVLPNNVYIPVRRMLDADLAVQQGRPEGELIPSDAIPADELGAIMRSRNESVLKLRAQGAALRDALARLESVANDLKRKNHLLETARRNLADADRLAGLGILSAGIAHELNTPLAVVKGLAERLAEEPARGLDPAEAQLMLRVVGRLERLSESLLDYARVRPPSTRPAELRAIVEEAMTLVRLDRDARSVELSNGVGPGLTADCDPDRMVQVFVNLVRNAVDAVRGRDGARVWVEGASSRRDGRSWASVTVNDNGPGIDPGVLPRLFEPFVTTRLDSHGTGLGLAVAEGIVREHAGLVLARNRPDGGAAFEVLLPREAAVAPAVAPQAGDNEEPP
ncbi:MAG TPA: HAMP domain-containing sensor histidine kinase [Phycisphaerales bacterium]|nr:HAMP domain-containing sensor histidine kinase [Phycisphaerales bacterium]